ncbi:MAG: YcaO-like family protein [Micromonosporaceae bacterium]
MGTGAPRSAGISQAVVVDLTREEFGIPVVRAVVPGLEGPIELDPSCLPGRRAMDLAGRRRAGPASRSAPC